MIPGRFVVGLVLSVGFCLGCVAPTTEEVPITTIEVVPAPGAEARDLVTADDVEQLVREYGECAVAQAPGAGLAIGFDPETGFVGGSEAAARTSGLLDQLESAMDSCDAKLAFRASTDAYLQRTPEAREFATRGLMPTPGSRLVFGDRSLFQP